MTSGDLFTVHEVKTITTFWKMFCINLGHNSKLAEKAKVHTDNLPT